MATVINITNKIKRQPKFIVCDGKNYPVDGSKNTVLEALGLVNNHEIDNVTRIDMVLDLLIGKAARMEFDALDLDDYRAVMAGAMAAATGQTQSEFESSFREDEGTEPSEE